MCETVLKEPLAIGEHQIFQGVSIGVAVRGPSMDQTAEQLLCQADADMYRVKKSGKALRDESVQKTELIADFSTTH
ncbi:MAG: diguanylate cyclase [Rubrobacter sp.]|nr:diguanylate cyclase [Rubrobacter sp.]